MTLRPSHAARFVVAFVLAPALLTLIASGVAAARDRWRHDHWWQTPVRDPHAR